MSDRREFIQKSAVGATALTMGGLTMSSKSYGRIIGANDRVNVAVIGFSDRFNSALFPSFNDHAKTKNFQFVALSDLWSKRREEGKAFMKQKGGWDVEVCRNNDELYQRKDVDAVIISSPDFAHASHLAEAANNKKDAYCEKPFAETMEDAKAGLNAVLKNKTVVQIGSQRRSTDNYIAANEYLRSGKFGDIVMVEMSWNVNQPARWRRPETVKQLKEADTDWKRFQLNRPQAAWDPRKYLEFRLFWPYSSGIPGQWMCHQIDTVHWFTGLAHPRSVATNGGIYQWKDGRSNADTLTSVFDYGDDKKGFQVVYTSRFSNSAGGTKELYYSNGGMLNLDTNKVTSEGGLGEREAKDMGMKANLLANFELPKVAMATGADTSKDLSTSNHMLNWMECVRSRQKTHAPIEAGYSHAIAIIMANAAYRTGLRATFDEKLQEVICGGKPFKF